ncbi:oligodendrocyte-myelin glycoprotein-like [Pseudoliparis swirei]|uniref:oligodendrocyte-myelin glycoprotein-like n=1 Tax=Pseudoliparis swirei TaxID=2059687 RepID=UPI0024BE3B68|nr:oligodendrocyte-myelin glycoprotein-like [Pseudoliparis swirei]
MRSRRVLPQLSPNEALLELLLVLLLGPHVFAVCPSMCSCGRSHREVDCSWRGLRQLPDGLQHNARSLNLSHNRLHNLDGQLTAYTHLRLLDLSHNRLSHLPAGLPRSLWQLHVASNRLQLLDKNDTVHQWNLRLLDLSDNKLERAVFINNTLTNLCTLNLSHNHFWTLPTNMPVHLENIDLSHNLLVKMLPGSLDQLLRLTHFYLHANRLSTLPFGVFDKMSSLRVITLGDNPWACHLDADITYLLSWTQHTPARVLGCPCHTQPVCGGVRPGRTGGWHFGSHNLQPLAAGAQDMSSMAPEASITAWWHVSGSAPHPPEEAPTTQHQLLAATLIGPPTQRPRSTGTRLTMNPLYAAADHMVHTESADSLHASGASSFPATSFVAETPILVDMTLATEQIFTTESPSIQTRKTTTLRTRSVRRKNQSVPSGISNGGPAPTTRSSHLYLHTLGLLSLVMQRVL